jgi:hypothetical protein
MLNNFKPVEDVQGDISKAYGEGLNAQVKLV